jgi:hypothetical protein
MGVKKSPLSGGVGFPGFTTFDILTLKRELLFPVD